MNYKSLYANARKKFLSKPTLADPEAYLIRYLNVK